MRDKEKNIDKSLPDETSKREFIKEFWKIRDPDPTTEYGAKYRTSSKKILTDKQVFLPAEVFDFDVVPVAGPQSVSFVGCFQTYRRGR